MTLPRNFEARRIARQTGAKDRQAAKRHPLAQLKHLDTVFGNGVGAKKERAKLAKILEAKIEKALEANNNA